MIHTGLQAQTQIHTIQLTCSRWVGWASLLSALLASSPSHPPSSCQGYCPGVFSLLTARNCINTTRNANATRKTSLTPNALYAISIYNKQTKKTNNNNSFLICTASGALYNHSHLRRLKPFKSRPVSRAVFLINAHQTVEGVAEVTHTVWPVCKGSL